MVISKLDKLLNKISQILTKLFAISRRGRSGAAEQRLEEVGFGRRRTHDLGVEKLAQHLGESSGAVGVREEDLLDLARRAHEHSMASRAKRECSNRSITVF